VQPDGCAFQVWDAKTIPRPRREEYGDGVVQKIIASTIEELAGGLMDEGLKDKESFLRTVREYNDAVHQHRMGHPGSKWDPAVKDGLSTQSSRKLLAVAKSNWALPVEKGPSWLSRLPVVSHSRSMVWQSIQGQAGYCLSGEAIRGLFCAGEMVEDLYYNNYPGGSGLMAGTVWDESRSRSSEIG